MEDSGRSSALFCFRLLSGRDPYQRLYQEYESTLREEINCAGPGIATGEIMSKNRVEVVSDDCM